MYEICAASGLPANEYCPIEQVTETVYILGGAEEGTTESTYVLPSTMLEQICPLHNESTIQIPDTPGVTDIPNSEDAGTTDVPDNSQTSGEGSENTGTDTPESSTGTDGSNTGGASDNSTTQGTGATP